MDNHELRNNMMKQINERFYTLLNQLERAIITHCDRIPESFAEAYNLTINDTIDKIQKIRAGLLIKLNDFYDAGGFETVTEKKYQRMELL